jgi:hypothetical protein
MHMHITYVHAHMQGQATRRRRERLSDCARIAAARPYLKGGKQLAPRRLSPRVFFSGAVQTKTRGPGLCAPSPLYSTLPCPDTRLHTLVILLLL